MKEQKVIHYEHFASLENMPAEDRSLIEAAAKATLSAHAPYSHFRVGAAARLQSGATITAANCESEVFPSGMCAERSLLYFHASNHPCDNIVALAIASDPAERADRCCSTPKSVSRAPYASLWQAEVLRPSWRVPRRYCPLHSNFRL